MQTFQTLDASLSYRVLGPENAPITFVWAHGWGQSHAAFLPLAEGFTTRYRHILLDLPGFGAAPPPPAHWGITDYADLAASFLETIPGRKLWIGHSFGCRIGLRLAARHPRAVEGLFLIAAAGLKRKRPLTRRISSALSVKTFKFLKKCVPLGLVDPEWLYQSFGSADYRSAGPLRPVFVRTVGEYLDQSARQIRCPVHLVYGDKDTETPPDIGERLQALIPGSRLSILPDLGHYTLLGQGRHRVAALLATFAEKIETAE